MLKPGGHLKDNEKDYTLPYKIIAKWNGLQKVKPFDDDDRIWTSHEGNKYLLTPLGFISAIQNNFKVMYEQENKIASDLKFKLEECKEDYKLLDPNNNIGRGTKTTIKSILGSNMSDQEKVAKIKEYMDKTC